MATRVVGAVRGLLRSTRGSRLSSTRCWTDGESGRPGSRRQSRIPHTAMTSSGSPMANALASCTASAPRSACSRASSPARNCTCSVSKGANGSPERVASVPESRHQLAALLVDHQLHERAGIEVDERHVNRAGCSRAPRPTASPEPCGGRRLGVVPAKSGERASKRTE